MFLFKYLRFPLCPTSSSSSSSLSKSSPSFKTISGTTVEVQKGHREALRSILEKQCPHCANCGAFFLFIRFTALTNMKMMTDITTKLRTEFRKTPTPMTIAPSSFACVKDLYLPFVMLCFLPLFRRMNIFAKSTPLKSQPIGGMMISFTKEFAIRPKAPPFEKVSCQ